MYMFAFVQLTHGSKSVLVIQVKTSHNNFFSSWCHANRNWWKLIKSIDKSYDYQNYGCHDTWTYLFSCDCSMWRGMRADKTVEEVAYCRREVHHIHTLHVDFEEVLGGSAYQFRYSYFLQNNQWSTIYHE